MTKISKNRHRNETKWSINTNILFKLAIFQMYRFKKLKVYFLIVKEVFKKIKLKILIFCVVITIN